MRAIQTQQITADIPKRFYKDLISNPHSVSALCAYADLSADMIAEPNIDAVGVIDAEGACVGYISRRVWLEQAAAAYIENGTVPDTIAGLVSDNICLVDSLETLDVLDKESLDDLNEEIWFTVVDGENRFSGLFSSNDILKYLSGLLFQDMRIAEKIHSRINKRTEAFKVGPYAVGTFSLPATGIGGDLVFVKKLTETVLLFSLFDVSGKGNGAAMVSSIMYGILNLVSPKISLGTLVRVINMVLCRTFRGELFSTGFIGLLSCDTGIMEVVDMGHSHCFLTGSDARLDLKQANIPLGVDPDAAISSTQIKLSAEKALVLITDGIVEQKNAQGAEYDIPGMLNKIADSFAAGVQVQEVLRSALDEYNSFIGLKHQGDDASMIIIKNEKGQ